MYHLRDQVLYFNRPAWIVGIRQPGRHQTGRFYDLARTPGSTKIAFHDVAEQYMQPFPVSEPEWIRLVK